MRGLLIVLAICAVPAQGLDTDGLKPLTGFLEKEKKVAKGKASEEIDDLAAEMQEYADVMDQDELKFQKTVHAAKESLKEQRWHPKNSPISLPTARAGLAMKEKSNVTKKGGPKIDTYVINVDARKDRCECMKKQLDAAPQAVYRHSANHMSDCGLEGNMDAMDGGRNHEAEQSLFCSNFKVWETASKSDADFIVVFEDDSLIKEGFWDKVTNLLSMDCSEKIDYLVVDMFRIWNMGETDPNMGGRRDDLCGGEHNLFHIPKPVWLGAGAHMQVIRKTYLKDLMESAKQHGAGTPDQWIKLFMPGDKFFMWQPDIVTQSITMSQEEFAAISGCGSSVGHSDLALRQKGPEQTLKQKGWFDAPRMQCA